MDPSGPAFDLDIPLDVVLGTIPLMSVVQQRPPMAPVGFDGATPWPTAPPPEAGMPQFPPNLREYRIKILLTFLFTSLLLLLHSIISSVGRGGDFWLGGPGFDSRCGRPLPTCWVGVSIM